MNKFSLEEMIKSTGARMRADLAERLTAHPGELGAGREEVIRRFLRAYLPSRFNVSSGFVFDSKGDVSRQLDIVVTDSLVCPHFESTGGVKYYPCESVVAVGQIKSSITSETELIGAPSNLESVKHLDRSAGGQSFDGLWGEEINHRTNHLHQIFTFLFVTGRSLSPETIQTKLMDHVLATAPHVWTNVVLALDKYLVTFCCDEGVCPNPMDARGLALQAASKDDELLMRFYLLLGQAIQVTRVSGLPYWEYLSAANKWSASVSYSSSDSPPPFLGSLTTG